jgi:thiol-disulfide isomerase/thioredoxin
VFDIPTIRRDKCRVKHHPIFVIALCGAIAVAGSSIRLEAQDLKAPAAAPATGPTAELNALVSGIKDKLKNGQTAEADFAAEFKAFDALIAKYGSQKTDEVAQILTMKAMLYMQVFQDYEKSLVVLKQLKADFPDTQSGQKAAEIIPKIEQVIESGKVAEGLKPGSVFPDFSEKDLDGKPLNLESHRGRVVMVDFWATWCGPCVAEFPNVHAAYEKYHSKGFDIIGISLDEDRAALDSFIKEKGVAWPLYFDGKGWENKLARQYGITSIPATYLLDQSGKIVSVGLRGSALDTELATLLSK